jgi:hypothetical protein
VSDAKENLEKALELSLRLHQVSSALRDWLTSQLAELSRGQMSAKKVVDVAKEMVAGKRAEAEDVIE